jgi:hypothetical protein
MKSGFGKSLRSLLTTVGSLWLGAAILALLLAAMACATVAESLHGREQVLVEYYRAWWFQALFVLLAINSLAAIARRVPFGRQQIGFLLTHGGVLVTLGGSAVSHHFSVEGQIGLAEGQSDDRMTWADRDALLVWNGRDEKQEMLELDLASLGTGHSISIPDGPSLIAGSLRAQVIGYLPDCEWRQQVFDDNPTTHPAVEVSLSSAQSETTTWVPADQTALVHGIRVSFRHFGDRDELQRELHPPATTQPASQGTVKIEFRTATFEFPVENLMKGAVPLGETGCGAHVVRYLPHATVGAGGQIVNASEQAVNPYIEIEITGPDVNEIHRAFAKFPDFDVSHGANQKERAAKVRFLAGVGTTARSPIEVLSGPDSELHVRFSDGGASGESRPLIPGEVLDSPWPNRKFGLLRRFMNARSVWTLEPKEPPRKQRIPGLHVRLSTPVQSNDLWLQKHESQGLTVDGKPFEVGFGDAVRPLGFSVKLERFRVGYYPGGQRPRSFESQVVFTDPVSARTESAVVSMNRPASFRGYTFYQSSYRQEGGRAISHLSVSRDAGQLIVFAGYLILIAGMLTVLVSRLLRPRTEAGLSREALTVECKRIEAVSDREGDRRAASA